ncbi:MAG TPA: inositol monophosphatase family protein [Aggregatilineales bacterium]|nr:inositol monophosphatase family protein [Aggregatilineales bacterium]
MIQELMETAMVAARAAGEVLREKVNQPRQITEKGYLDIVTDADLAADEVIQTIIRRAYPDHFILSEESEDGHHISEWKMPEGFWWAIDPLDGTTNFSRGVPLWSISVGVAYGSELRAAAVYDVNRNDLFSAGRGLGAFCNEKPITINTQTELRRSLISVDWPVAAEKRSLMLQFVNELLPHVRTLRCWGTSALAMAHVAAGYLDAYMQLGQKPWDVMAGSLLVMEAGGIVSDVDGRSFNLQRPSLLACSPHLHPEITALIAPYLA